MYREKKKLLWWLAGVNLLISAFTFGGGYVVVPMIRKYFVRGKNLFSEEKLMDMAAVAQSSPGAIAVNLSALAGMEAAGIAGVIISGVSAVLPPLIILSVISVFYSAFSQNPMIAAALKGMQAGAAAYILDFVIDMTEMIVRERSRFLLLLAPASFFAAFFLKWNVAVILGTGCILCFARIWVSRRKDGFGRRGRLWKG